MEPRRTTVPRQFGEAEEAPRGADSLGPPVAPTVFRDHGLAEARSSIAACSVGARQLLRQRATTDRMRQDCQLAASLPRYGSHRGVSSAPGIRDTVHSN